MPFFLLAVGAIVIVAAMYDAMTLTIPNWISLALIGLFPVVAFLAGFDLSTVGIHVAVGSAALITGMVLFAFHFIGGGDAKFFAAVSFYVGLSAAGSYLMTVVIAGGVLAIVLMMARRLAQMGFAMDWFLRFTRGGSVIPYGIAIAFGALTVLPQTQIFASAMA
ncbi:MAG: prepilin peptidase [Micropepsaceae bacterium]